MLGVNGFENKFLQFRPWHVPFISLDLIASISFIPITLLAVIGVATHQFNQNANKRIERVEAIQSHATLLSDAMKFRCGASK